jgi:hypothetical protein
MRSVVTCRHEPHRPTWMRGRPRTFRHLGASGARREVEAHVSSPPAVGKTCEMSAPGYCATSAARPRSPGAQTTPPSGESRDRADALPWSTSPAPVAPETVAFHVPPLLSAFASTVWGGRCPEDPPGCLSPFSGARLRLRVQRNPLVPSYATGKSRNLPAGENSFLTEYLPPRESWGASIFVRSIALSPSCAIDFRGGPARVCHAERSEASGQRTEPTLPLVRGPDPSLTLRACPERSRRNDKNDGPPPQNVVAHSPWRGFAK